MLWGTRFAENLGLKKTTKGDNEWRAAGLLLSHERWRHQQMVCETVMFNRGRVDILYRVLCYNEEQPLVLSQRPLLDVLPEGHE